MNKNLFYVVERGTNRRIMNRPSRDNEPFIGDKDAAINERRLMNKIDEDKEYVIITIKEYNNIYH